MIVKATYDSNITRLAAIKVELDTKRQEQRTLLEEKATKSAENREFEKAQAEAAV